MVLPQRRVNGRVQGVSRCGGFVGFVGVALLVATGACSVLVNPNTSRLPGGDAVAGSDGAMEDDPGGTMDVGGGADRVATGDVRRDDTPAVDVPPSRDVILPTDDVLRVDAPMGCLPPYIVCAGTCRDPSRDPSNCGSCGRVCPTPPNTLPSCMSGSCAFQCMPGFANCDANLSNGCETDIANSAENCGRCGMRCSSGPGSGTCVRGMCSTLMCPMGTADCDGVPTNGCEANLATNSRCGSCTHACGTTYGMCLVSGSVGPVCCRDVMGVCGSWNCSGTCRSSGLRSYCCER
jgi:hypothetical protein